MKLLSHILVALLLTSCGRSSFEAESATATPDSAPAPTTRIVSPTSDNTPTSAAHAYRTPAQKSTWQIQYTGAIDTSLDVDVFNLDLFETDPDTLSALHKRRVFAMCYFSAGSHEDWRPDAGDFSIDVLGDELDGWPGERWLDIRRTDLLRPIMEARLDLAVEKSCDGVDPDNVDGYINETGFSLSYEDQLAYNIFLAQAAHARGLSIGLKNDLKQVIDLLPYFDWALNEQCFFYEECDLLLPFIEAGKPVFQIEYDLEPRDFCAQARAMSFNSIRKHLELDSYFESCD